MRIHPSPVVELNHAVAVSMVDGPERAPAARCDSIAKRGELNAYHMLPAVRADLLRRLGRRAEAIDAYQQALKGVELEPERRFLAAPPSSADKKRLSMSKSPPSVRLKGGGRTAESVRLRSSKHSPTIARSAMIHVFPYYTAIYAAVLGLLAALLTVNVIVDRVRAKVDFADGGVAALGQAIRAHANFAEHTPLGASAHRAGGGLWLPGAGGQRPRGSSSSSRGC